MNIDEHKIQLSKKTTDPSTGAIVIEMSGPTSKNLDQYGRGRLSVLQEMIDWCDTEIDKIKSVGFNSDTHSNATMTGHIKAYSKMKEKLHAKINRLR